MITVRKAVSGLHRRTSNFFARGGGEPFAQIFTELRRYVFNSSHSLSQVDIKLE